MKRLITVLCSKIFWTFGIFCDAIFTYKSKKLLFSGFQGFVSYYTILILIQNLSSNAITAVCIQIEACSLEALRIEALINTATPSFTSHFILSTLKFADTQTPSLSAQVQGSSRHLMSVEHLILALIQTYLIIKWILSS